jgi:hypothetical protein
MRKPNSIPPKHTRHPAVSGGHPAAVSGGKLSIDYDSAADILTIEGIRYAGDVFRTLAQPPDEFLYQLGQQEDGLVVINRVAEKHHPAVSGGEQSPHPIA